MYPDHDGVYLYRMVQWSKDQIDLLGPEIIPPPSLPPVARWLDEKEFYELMQGYRNCPLSDQKTASLRFEGVKAFIRTMMSKDTINNSIADPAQENPMTLNDA